MENFYVDNYGIDQPNNEIHKKFGIYAVTKRRNSLFPQLIKKKKIWFFFTQSTKFAWDRWDLLFFAPSRGNSRFFCDRSTKSPFSAPNRRNSQNFWDQTAARRWMKFTISDWFWRNFPIFFFCEKLMIVSCDLMTKNAIFFPVIYWLNSPATS